MTKPALTPAQFAEKYCIGRDTVGRMIKTGKLGAIRVGIGGQRQALRITAEQEEAWLRASSVQPVPEPAPPKRRARKDPAFVEYYK